MNTQENTYTVINMFPEKETTQEEWEQWAREINNILKEHKNRQTKAKQKLEISS